MVYFLGAGPGDPELITLKGKRLLENADAIIYAGSLVNPALLEYAKSGCEVFDSASMTLDEVMGIIEKYSSAGKTVVRLHTGDPSIYGAIREQMALLDSRNMAYEQVPGVSSFSAAAAALKKEYTLPGVTQTVILTRVEGRTGVPESESIERLAEHKASMAIFLSVHMIDSLVDSLKKGYGGDTPVAVVFKASWPDQRIVRGTLGNIASLVKGEGIRKTALVLVGNFLGDEFELSKLYDRNFSHGYRSAE